MWKVIGLVLTLASMSATIGQAAVLCATKKGAVKLRETCKPKETPIDAAAVGAQGPKGDKGDQGVAGAPGAGLVTLAQTLGPIALSGSYGAVAATAAADAPDGNGGAWYGPITNPATSTVFVVTAHATTDAASGALDCQLERSRSGAPYEVVATAVTGANEVFLNDAFPAFTIGDTYNFRLSCRVTGGSRSVMLADIGAVASVRT
jgi:hypothetical protein